MRKMAGILAVMLVLGVAMGSMAWAEDAAPMAEEKSLQLTGTVLSDNTFLDADGQKYQLSDTEQNRALQDLVGETIKIHATVMEEAEGRESISVSSYEIVNQ